MLQEKESRLSDLPKCCCERQIFNFVEFFPSFVDRALFSKIIFSFLQENVICPDDAQQ